MDVLEIIRLRTNEREKVLSVHNFEEHLKEFKKSDRNKLLPHSIMVYQHQNIKTDLSVLILYKNLGQQHPEPSFGSLIKLLLKDWGLVNYSIWKQAL